MQTCHRTLNLVAGSKNKCPNTYKGIGYLSRLQQTHNNVGGFFGFFIVTYFVLSFNIFNIPEMPDTVITILASLVDSPLLFT